MSHEKKDLAFCANIKKRSALILRVLKEREENDISVSMALFSNDASERQLFSEYSNSVKILNRFMKYEESLRFTLNANYVLDIVQDGQVALSM